jgi:hypothetical protein
MKRILFQGLGLAVLGIAAVAAQAATPAQMQLHCLSVKFHPASSSAAGLSYTLELTTDASGATGSNGELAPLPSGGASSHASFFRLSGDALIEPASGSFFLDVPKLSDANTNGVPDFFEVDLAVESAITAGTFEGADQSGKITATWSRAAKSSEGVCQVTLDAYKITFTNRFEIQEFAGTLAYRNTTGETNVITAATLSRKAQTITALSGTMVFAKQGGGRLSLLAGELRSPGAPTLAYHGIDDLERTGARFNAAFVFKDGDPGTSVEDYVSWVLKIVDPADSNGDGIPDLSDDGGRRLPPLLSLQPLGTNLLLSITGEIGKLHQVETIQALEQGNWILAATVTLSNEIQTVLLRAPTNRSRTAFWRVKVP